MFDKLFIWSAKAKEARRAEQLRKQVAGDAAVAAYCARLYAEGFEPEDDQEDPIDTFFGLTLTREERRARRLAREANEKAAPRIREVKGVWLTGLEGLGKAQESSAPSSLVSSVSTTSSSASSAPSPERKTAHRARA